MRSFSTFICLILILSKATGQPMDSIGFTRARIQAGKYELNQFGITKIKIKTKGPSAIGDDGISTGEKLTGGVFTLLTGWSTSSSSQSMWMLKNEVKIEGIDKKMLFPVYISGTYERSRDRVENDDGSSSMETIETYDLFWDEGAEGDIFQNEQKIGDFSVKTRSLENSQIEYWTRTAQYLPLWLEEKMDAFEYYSKPSDFIVYIVLQDQEYLLIYHGEYYQCALVQDDKMIALWQDAPSNVLSKKNRIKPYLQLQKQITDFEARKVISLLALGQTLARNQTD